MGLYCVRILISAVVFLSAGVLSAQQLKFQTGSIRFTVNSRLARVTGDFKQFQITRADSGKGQAEVLIQMNSLDTGIAKRDNHLRGEDFFEVSKFSTANLFLESLTSSGSNQFQARGKLTIKGTTKDVAFPVTVSMTQNNSQYSGQITLNRQDFGITYSSALNPIEDNVVLEFSLSFATPEKGK